MNHKTFMAQVLAKAGKTDRYGFCTLAIGRYRFRTNGTDWTCIVNDSNNPVTRLAVVIQEWERQKP